MQVLRQGSEPQGATRARAIAVAVHVIVSGGRAHATLSALNTAEQWSAIDRGVCGLNDLAVRERAVRLPSTRLHGRRPRERLRQGGDCGVRSGAFSCTYDICCRPPRPAVRLYDWSRPDVGRQLQARRADVKSTPC